jgi:hypothetical protein
MFENLKFRKIFDFKENKGQSFSQHNKDRSQNGDYILGETKT